MRESSGMAEICAVQARGDRFVAAHLSPYYLVNFIDKHSAATHVPVGRHVKRPAAHVENGPGLNRRDVAHHHFVTGGNHIHARYLSRSIDHHRLPIAELHGDVLGQRRRGEGAHGRAGEEDVTNNAHWISPCVKMPSHDGGQGITQSTVQWRSRVLQYWTR